MNPSIHIKNPQISFCIILRITKKYNPIELMELIKELPNMIFTFKDLHLYLENVKRQANLLPT